mgnify:CR=1 FL=1
MLEVLYVRIALPTAKKFLVMGLSGSGKTTFAKNLVDAIEDVTWLNADKVRAEYDDWDFSYGGRIRQAKRLRELSDKVTTEYVVCDFIAPTKEIRDIYAADYVVWMDTVKNSKYSDTDKLFEPPKHYNLKINNT